MFYVLHLVILNSIKVSKINLQRTQFKLGRPSTEKIKFKHLDGVFEMFHFPEILIICGFVFVKINLML